ncbi:MAG TPA: glycosyltransferase, partial [Pseudonocardiaceae bacterium]|nr:glycosyltransferase [Pseudonocardiaceae bacterium]
MSTTGYGQELAVVTVTYSPGATLETFLDSVAKATTRPVRVLLADNGSTDGAPERAAQRDGVSLLRIGENVGYGTAANRAVVELGPEVGWVVVA